MVQTIHQPSQNPIYPKILKILIQTTTQQVKIKPIKPIPKIKVQTVAGCLGWIIPNS